MNTTLSRLPEDFNPTLYKKYNPDLKDCTDEWVGWHYLNYGLKENRIYKIENLPEYFDAEQYRFLNPDLKSFNNYQCEAHYVKWGIKENRKYWDPFFDKNFFANQSYAEYMNDITQIKSQKILELINQIPQALADVILVNHNSSLNGASHHLYLLFNLLKFKYNLKVIIATPTVCDSVLSKYDLKKSDFVEYFDDPTILYHICTKINCKKIYFNSLNLTMNRVAVLLDKNKLILHAHEIQQHYHSSMYPNTLVPHFNINQADILQYPPGSNIEYQTGILPNTFLDNIEIISQQQVSVKNSLGEMDFNKITIGMSGIKCDRKNYKLFVETAKLLPNYNFLWVGGEGSLTDKLIDNLYHVPQTPWPFAYYKLIDYFVLFSSIEPMGYVILENLYLGNSVIAFNDSLCTKFSTEQMEDMFNIIPGSITLERLIQILPQLCSVKPLKNKERGKKYVKKFFKINETFIKAFL